MMTTGSNTITYLRVQNAVFYMITLLIAFGLKYHYSRAGSDDLNWILAPTAELVEYISGIPFEYEIGSGYVNHEKRIIIAPACAGVNFLIIAFCMAVFSGVHCFECNRLKFLWMATSAASAYLLTILVNTLRIILSVYVYDAAIYYGWITPQRVHRLEGVVIYFFFLYLFYRIIIEAIHHYLRRIAHKRRSGINRKLATSDYVRWACAGLIPLFWYGLITLGIPLANAAYSKNGARFVEHSGMVILGCLMVMAAIFLIQLAWQSIGNWLKRFKTE